MKKVGIIFAMDEEKKAFLNLVKKDNEYNIFDLYFDELIINNLNCILVTCGVGKVNAARCTQILIDNYQVDIIINIGVAGGISNSLQIGDIILGERLVQHDFDITAFNHEKVYILNIGVYINSDEYLLNICEDILNKNNISYQKGVIASGDIFCTDYVMSNKINKKFNALCVEMEGASIAQVCYLSHIPFLVIRAVSDIPNNDNVITYEEFLEESSNKIARVLKKMLENCNL